MAEKTYTYVPAELKSAAVDGVVVSAEGVFDYDYGENGQNQSEINRRVAEILGLGEGPSSAYANNSKITLKNDLNEELGHFTLNQESPKTIQIPTPKNSEVRFHKGDSENAFASFTLNKGSDTDIWLDEPGNGTLKFKKNGTVFETFSANQSEDVTIDLTGIGSGDDPVGVQSDWNETNPNSLAYIYNKPRLDQYITQSNLSDYATKSYVDDAVEDIVVGQGGGEVNQLAFSNINVINDQDSTIIQANSKTDTFYLKAGNNITLTVEGNTIIISATGTSGGGTGGGTTVTTKTVYYGYYPSVPTASTVSNLSQKQVSSIIGTYWAAQTYIEKSQFYFVIPSEWTINYVSMNGFAFPMRELESGITVNDKIYKIYKSTCSDTGYDQNSSQDRIYIEE